MIVNETSHAPNTPVAAQDAAPPLFGLGFLDSEGGWMFEVPINQINQSDGRHTSLHEFMDSPMLAGRSRDELFDVEEGPLHPLLRGGRGECCPPAPLHSTSGFEHHSLDDFDTDLMSYERYYGPVFHGEGGVDEYGSDDTPEMISSVGWLPDRR